jgi:ATP-dependent 26S proteasome regulatory subunit
MVTDQHSIVYHITETSKVKVEAKPLTQTTNNSSSKEDGTPKDTSKKIAYDQIGGLAEQVATVREMVETTLKNPELFIQYGNGILSSLTGMAN